MHPAAGPPAFPRSFLPTLGRGVRHVMSEFDDIKPLPVKPLFEIFREAEEREAYRATLPANHPDHPTGAEISENGEITVFWGPYRYDWGWNVTQPIHLLRLLSHVGKKPWAGMTPKRMAKLIDRVAELNGWNVHSSGALHKRGTTADEERAKLTPSLRFRVLKRDGYRCRACGSGPEHGAVLHIDHRVAIAKGGLTEFNNLQTLCASCNYGKRTEAE